MPDLKEATNHLAPLDLPAQITMFYPDRKDRVGFQVDDIHPEFPGRHDVNLPERIPPKHRSFALNDIASATGCPLISISNGASV